MFSWLALEPLIHLLILLALSRHTDHNQQQLAKSTAARALGAWKWFERISVQKVR